MTRPTDGEDAVGTRFGVVVHLDEAVEGKHAAVLRNVSNLLEDLGPDTPVELVTHGDGVGVCLRDSPEAEAVQALLRRGVSIVACENTLRGKGISRDELAPGVGSVPAGIGELVRRQRAGWSYIRP